MDLQELVAAPLVSGNDPDSVAMGQEVGQGMVAYEARGSCDEDERVGCGHLGWNDVKLMGSLSFGLVNIIAGCHLLSLP